MNLVELTMVLAISLAMITAAFVQGNNQYEVIRTYKQVEYYSSDVPRMITAVQNITRGAKSFWIVSNTGAAATANGPLGPGNGMSSMTIGGALKNGEAIVIGGEEKHDDGAGGTKTVGFMTRLFLVERKDITPFASGRYEDRTGAVDLLDNKYHLAIKSVRRDGTETGSLSQPGWYLIRNIAGVQFDHIPGTDGLVLMRIFRQYQSGAAAQLAFEQVLERR